MHISGYERSNAQCTPVAVLRERYCDINLPETRLHGEDSVCLINIASYVLRYSDGSKVRYRPVYRLYGFKSSSSSSGQAPDWSVAVSTNCLHRSLSWASNHVELSLWLTITRTPADEGTALVAGGAAHLIQAGRVDVQDTAHGVSQSTHQGTDRHSVTAVIVCSASRRAVQTN